MREVLLDQDPCLNPLSTGHCFQLNRGFLTKGVKMSQSPFNGALFPTLARIAYLRGMDVSIPFQRGTVSNTSHFHLTVYRPSQSPFNGALFPTSKNCPHWPSMWSQSPFNGALFPTLHSLVIHHQTYVSIPFQRGTVSNGVLAGHTAGRARLNPLSTGHCFQR